MKKLFLCHHSASAEEIYALAEELRLRGIVPWIDKHGGFSYGDTVPEEARRAINEDCFGLIFYATPEAFRRSFILNVELDTALRKKAQDKDFLLTVIARNMSWEQISRMSIKTLGVDLSIYHGGSVQDQDAEGIRHLPLRPQFAQIAGEVLDSYLDLQRDEISKTKTIGLQVSTREILPSDDDLLLVDAVALFAQHGVCSPDQWARLEKGLLDIKKKIAERFGRPRIRISGSKHLTASYLVGRCFPAPSGFRLEIRTHTDVWSTDYPTAEDQPFEVSFEQGSPGSTAVYVEVDATGNPVHKAVQRYVRATGYSPHLYVKLHPKGGSRRGAVGVLRNPRKPVKPGA